MGNKLSRTPAQGNEILTLYFKRLLETKIEFKRSEEEIRDINNGVHQLVSRIISTIPQVDPRFEIGRSVLVGSMAEGTKICEPDEFDYIFVLKQLSSNAVKMRRKCDFSERIEDFRSGFCHVIINDEDLQQQWKNWVYGNQLICTRRKTTDTMRSCCWPWCQMCINFLDVGLKQELIEVVQEAVTMVVDNSVETESGVVSIKDIIVARHGPALKLNFFWKPRFSGSKNLDINIDITPAIELNLTKDTVLNTDVYDRRLLQCLKEIGKFMVTPCKRYGSCKGGLCFRLSFTETEVKLFTTGALAENDIREHHIKCYKILKYIFRCRPEIKTLFSSYALKTLLIQHMCSCKRTEQMALCVKDILHQCEKLAEGIQRKGRFTLNLPSLFILSHNIFHQKYFDNYLATSDQAIRKTQKSLDKIAKKKNWEKGHITRPIIKKPFYVKIRETCNPNIFPDENLSDDEVMKHKRHILCCVLLNFVCCYCCFTCMYLCKRYKCLN